MRKSPACFVLFPLPAAGVGSAAFDLALLNLSHAPRSFPTGATLMRMVRRILLLALAAMTLFVSGAGAAEFEAASLKASKAGGGRGSMSMDSTRLTYTNVSVRDCIMSAWNVKDYQIDGPGWLRTDRYDLAATASAPSGDDALKGMLQTLLLDRFQMKVHIETRDLPVYAMVVAKGGAKLKGAAAPGRPAIRMSGGGVVFTSVTINDLIDLMARARFAELDRPVVDDTGLTGRYDITVNLFGTQEELMSALSKGDFGSSIFTLIQEQLGLKLEAKKLPLQMVVVDQAERTPSEN
ncbi:MAG TPA: TIGR03435 family protein [Bryobacteraceae bacterium]|nr:TIGR03435 family protein [Bryobacteraceae bacterium]